MYNWQYIKDKALRLMRKVRIFSNLIENPLEMFYIFETWQYQIVAVENIVSENAKNMHQIQENERKIQKNCHHTGA